MSSLTFLIAGIAFREYLFRISVNREWIKQLVDSFSAFLTHFSFMLYYVIKYLFRLNSQCLQKVFHLKSVHFFSRKSLGITKRYRFDFLWLSACFESETVRHKPFVTMIVETIKSFHKKFSMIWQKYLRREVIEDLFGGLFRCQYKSSLKNRFNVWEKSVFKVIISFLLLYKYLNLE